MTTPNAQAVFRRAAPLRRIWSGPSATDLYRTKILISIPLKDMLIAPGLPHSLLLEYTVELIQMPIGRFTFQGAIKVKQVFGFQHFCSRWNTLSNLQIRFAVQIRGLDERHRLRFTDAKTINNVLGGSVFCFTHLDDNSTRSAGKNVLFITRTMSPTRRFCH